MSIQQNTSLVKKLFEDIYTKNKLSELSQFFSSDVKLFDPATPNVKGGIQELKELEQMYHDAFPDKTLKIEDILATENKVAVRWLATGTHKGDLEEIAPTGTRIKIKGLSIYTISNGKITEINQNWDRLGLLEQLGAVEQTQALHR